MGLIKTAIMSGVGVYGIKQLSKAQEHRQSNQSPNPNGYSRDYNNNYPPQGPQQQGYPYYDGPSPPARGGRREDAYYGEFPDQQQQQQRQRYYPQDPATDRYNRGRAVEDEEDKYARQDGGYVYQARDGQFNNPPAYNSQQQGYQQQGVYQQQALPYEPQGQMNSSRTSGLTDMAMQFMENQQGGENDKKGKKGKGSDMFRDLLNK